MNAIQLFNYEGSVISFENKDNKVMINATEMAKPFGKRPSDWLKLPSSINFISALNDVRKSPLATELVKTVHGDSGGTWMHEDVALEFARWLNPAFGIWCNDRIKELLRTGVATLTNDDEAILHAMNVLQGRVSDLKQKNQILEDEKEHLEAENKNLLPKAQYTDEVLQSADTITFKQGATTLGMRSSNVLYAWLQSQRVLYRQSGSWLPYSKYADKGYFKTRTFPYKDTEGKEHSSNYLVITESGMKFIHELRKKFLAKQKATI